MQVQSLEVRSPADFDRAYQTALSLRAEALMPVSSRLLTLDRGGIIAFAAQHRLLLASGWGPWAREGAILSYGPDLDDITRRSAALVDKIRQRRNSRRTAGRATDQIPARDQWQGR